MDTVLLKSFALANPTAGISGTCLNLMQVSQD